MLVHFPWAASAKSVQVSASEELWQDSSVWRVGTNYALKVEGCKLQGSEFRVLFMRRFLPSSSPSFFNFFMSYNFLAAPVLDH